MFSPLNTHTCLPKIIVPLSFTQRDRIDADYSCCLGFNQIAPILSLTSMKTSRVSVKRKKRLEEWVRNPAVNLKFIAVHVNLSGTQ
jgi:hypothetical protein